MKRIKFIKRESVTPPGKRLCKEEAISFALSYYQKTYKFLEDK